MKKILLAALSIAVLLILAGCEAEQPSEVPGVTEPTVTEPGVTAPETTTAIPDTEPDIKEDGPAVDDITAEDLAFYDGALKLKDDKYCEKISSENLQKQCKQDIANSSVIAEAVAAQDESKCNQLEDTSKDLCLLQIELNKRQIDDFRELTTEENEIMLRAETAKDISICKEIESTTKRENCETNVNALINNL